MTNFNGFDRKPNLCTYSNSKATNNLFKSLSFNLIPTIYLYPQHNGLPHHIPGISTKPYEVMISKYSPSLDPTLGRPSAHTCTGVLVFLQQKSQLLKVDTIEKRRPSHYWNFRKKSLLRVISSQEPHCSTEKNCYKLSRLIM